MPEENYNYKQEKNNENVSFKEVLNIIKSWLIFFNTKKKQIIVSAIIGGIIGLIFAIYEKPTFKAALTFAMEEEKGGGSGLSSALGLASSIGIDLGGVGSGGGAFAAANLSELMKSRLIVEKVLLKTIEINHNKTTLAERYIEINNLREGWKNKPELYKINFLPDCKRINFSIQQDSILGTIYKELVNKEKLNISQKDKKVSIVTIEVISEDQLFSKLLCENLAQETSNFYIETKSKKARLNVDILQKQSDSVKNELNNAITSVASAADNVYNLNPSLNIKSAPSKKKQIDVQANTAVLTQIVVQLELAKINLRKETPLIQLIDIPILPLEKSQFGKLKSILIGSFILTTMMSFYLIILNLYKKNS